MSQRGGSTSVTIEWPCESVVASKKCEAAVSQVLHRKGEWGRGRDLPSHRINEITQACDQNGMTLYQALGLRRHMLRSFPGGMRRVNQSAKMGSDSGQRHLAALFEDALASFLNTAVIDQNVGGLAAFLTETQLTAEMRSGTRPRGPTPDILFLKPVLINGNEVKWMDAKSFYASAMYAANPKIPNGKLQKVAQRYNDHFGGKGAFVFSQGYCADLSSMVPGALLLDATPLDMAAYHAYQDGGKVRQIDYSRAP